VDSGGTRDDRMVKRVTRNIEKVLDTKLANVLKPVRDVRKARPSWDGRATSV